MKTAMQEWIEWLKAYEYELHLELQIKAKQMLEKEKEQIVTAFEDGYKSCDIDEAFEINRKLASGEQYYNQTFNK